MAACAVTLLDGLDYYRSLTPGQARAVLRRVQRHTADEVFAAVVSSARIARRQ